MQARTRLHQNILQSRTSPIRDNTLGVHNFRHSNVPDLPVVQTSTPSAGAVKISAQSAASREAGVRPSNCQPRFKTLLISLSGSLDGRRSPVFVNLTLLMYL
ncbi:hypothetical protein DL93DRAFT_2174601 [Clavulina sp. PMI_390]|nr:hypothetical protein DL93DRAFT_2174601 [Clavulina sp. PMI_390]